MLDFLHSLRTTQISIMLQECQNKRVYAMDYSLLPEQFKCYKAHQNMFSSFLKKKTSH